MTTMAMAHPRRYFSLSAAGAIAIRLPATSSRMYTSSVSDPLANTSKTPSAASSVASGRSVIICSTAALARRVMRSPSKAGPRVSRNGSRRQGVGRRRARRRPTPCRREPFRDTLGPAFEGDLMTRLARAAVEQMMTERPDATLEAALGVFEVFASGSLTDEVYILDDVAGKRIAIAPAALKEKYRRG